MTYLHEANVNERLVRHWANESEGAENTVGTHCVRQLETGILYGDAVDVVPCRYTYEATDIAIEQGEDT